MGGPGSGRWNSRASKKITDLQLSIDICLLNKKNCLLPGLIGSLSWSRGDFRTGSVRYEVETDKMILKYWLQSHGSVQNVEQSIAFDRTICNYGGYRNWFLCPKCCARSSVIYCAGEFFLCRRCCDLNYKTQKLGKAARLLQKARNIRKSLGGDNNLVAPFPMKPKNMHWKTYRRLCKQSEHAAFCGFVGKR